MNNEKCMNYDKMEQLERIFGSNPFDGLSKEEYEELLRQLNEDYEDDYQRNGRF